MKIDDTYLLYESILPDDLEELRSNNKDLKKINEYIKNLDKYTDNLRKLANSFYEDKKVFLQKNKVDLSEYESDKEYNLESLKIVPEIFVSSKECSLGFRIAYKNDFIKNIKDLC